jgi:branched-chain amino acid transport system substrate-binding protein
MRRAARLALILCIAASLGACGSGSDTSSGAKPGETKPGSSDWMSWVKLSNGPPFRIEVVSATSGVYSRAGDELRVGAGQAVDDYNLRDGIIGRAVTLRAADDKCDPKYAQAIARGIAAQHIGIVVGHLCPAATIAAASVYSENHILLLAPTTTDPALTDEAAARGSIDIIRVAPRDDQQGPLLAKHIRDRYPGASVALVSDGTPYGQTITGSTRQALLAAGVHLVLDETVVPAPAADASLVERLKAAQAGVVIYGGATADGARLLLEMRRQGSKAAFGGGNTLFAPEFWSIAGSAAEGAFTAWLPDPTSIMVGALQPLSSADAGLTSGLGTGINGYTLYAYAAVQVFAQAAARAKSIDPIQVAKAIRQGSYDTIVGTLTFDAKGDAQGLGFTIYAWHNGGYVTFN